MDRNEPGTSANSFGRAEPSQTPNGAEPLGRWPPHGWFKSYGVESSPGHMFDWSAPPQGFGPETARDWIDRAIRMQRYYLDEVGTCPSSWNDPRGSALGNANLLVENLSSRRASPAYPYRLYRGPMNQLTGDEELRELLVIRDWLERVVA